MPSRRSVLAAIGGSVTVGGLAIASGELPVRPRLRDVRLVNSRDEPVTIDLHLLANGETALRTQLDLDSGELIHLPCRWPAGAWSYQMKVRLAEMNGWESIRWHKRGALCKKISIRSNDSPAGPVSFFESPGCPPSIDAACSEA